MSTEHSILADGDGPRPLAEERLDRGQTTPATVAAAPRLWPLRMLALAGAIAQAVADHPWPDRSVVAVAMVVIGYTLFVSWRPVPYCDHPSARLRIAVEQVFYTVAVIVTGGWPSPFALCLIPTGMLAGFAAGTMFSTQLVTTSIIVISAGYISDAGLRIGIQASLLWAGLLGLVAFTSGLSYRAAADSARQQRLTLDRVSRLAEANSLLVALQRVAQTMPTSLDLDEVVDSTFDRVGSLMPVSSIALYLFEDEERRFDVYRHRGHDVRTPLTMAELPEPLRLSVGAPRTVREPHLDPGAGTSAEARSGIYTALRARGVLTGALAVESNSLDDYTNHHVEILHGLAETFGIAVDNARLFRRIRTISAHEERNRIARDLHDQVGSSLAFLGFEIDRANSIADRGADVKPVLIELRTHLTEVIQHVRESLYDLRTDVTDERDLEATLRSHLDRVSRRSCLITEFQVTVRHRPPRRHEHELWQMALEAITNVERHAAADHLCVSYRITGDSIRVEVADDGIGLNIGSSRTDRYGMVGMRERAESIGARLTVGANEPSGTRVVIELALLDEAHT